MFHIASLATLRLLVLVAQPGPAEASDVMLTSGGTVQKPSLMRRHTEDELQHHHKSGSAQAMFIALDLNGDGLVSGHEIKVSMKQAKFAIPQTLHNIMGDVDDTADGGISFAQFHGAAKIAEEKHALHLQETHRHHPDVVEQKAKIATQTPVTTESAWVTCGGSKAPTCDACPKTDADGQTVFDHGSEWCNADCSFSGGKCLPKGSVTGSGTSQGSSKADSEGHSSTAVSDLLVKEITPMDAEVINNAAGDAIKEEIVEASEKEQKQQEAEEAKKFSWGKFWLVVIITFSVILGICAIVSIVSLVVFCLMGQKRSGKGEDEEGEAFAEGEAEVADATADS